jgi:hypothetical protein
MSGEIAAAVGAVAFWGFVAVAAVASIVRGAFRHHETQKTIRTAIESGQTLDPQTLERLLQSGRIPDRRAFLVGGVLMLAIGVGLALAGGFMAHTDPRQLYQGLGAGSIVGLIGLGLIVSGLLLSPDRPGNQSE